MKTLFRGFIRYTKAEFDDLWANAHFVFDTNVLLNAYRYSRETATAFLETLEALESRLWLPHQVLCEFFAHYDKEIQSQLQAYGQLEVFVKGLSKQLRDKLPRHAYIPVDELSRKIDQLASSLLQDLETAKATHKDPTYDDPTLQKYVELFDGKVGPKPTAEELRAWQKEIDVRYEKKIPPGFEDAKRKSDARMYGDAILWFQLIAFATKSQKPIIFVTDEAKEDWWLQLGGKTIGPLPQLSQELYEKAGVGFYMYSMTSFIERATEGLGRKREAATVLEEIKEVEQQRTAERVHDEQPRRPNSKSSTFKRSIRRLLMLLGKVEKMNSSTFQKLQSFLSQQSTLLEDADSKNTNFRTPEWESRISKKRAEFTRARAEVSAVWSELPNEAYNQLRAELADLWHRSSAIKTVGEAAELSNRLLELEGTIATAYEKAQAYLDIGAPPSWMDIPATPTM